mgnify:CR=1 FL=1
MKTLQFSNQDQIPALGLGTWKSSPGEVGKAVIHAVQSGYRHIDCAAIYGNEKEIGEALAYLFKSGVVKREELFITSKLWNNAHRFDDVTPALHQTLADLQLDYLDLYLIHWPVAHIKGAVNPKIASDFLSLTDIPLIETWEGLIHTKKSGLTKHIGVSNFSKKKLTSLIINSSESPEVNQVESHPFLTQEPLIELCNKHNILLTAYSPLGSRDRVKENAPDLFVHKTIQSIAKTHQIPEAQVILAWGLQRNTIVIPKSITPARITENFNAQFVTLTPEEMKQISALNQDYRYIDGSFWVKDGNGYTLENLWD